MAFTVGTGTFTNGSTTVTNVSLSSGTLAYFASGTRMIVGANPVTAEVEAVAAPTVTTITLRSPWPHTGGTYDFLANQTSEGLRDAVQSIRNNNTTLQNYIDSISKAPNADTVLERTSTGAARVADAQNADEAVALGQLPDGVADLYAKNNVLGTVSQSAGVPTGAVIERGSNANGEYVKFADGTIEMYITNSSFHEVDVPYGSLFRSPPFSLPLPASVSASFAANSTAGVWTDAAGNAGYITFTDISSIEVVGCVLVGVAPLSSANRTRLMKVSARWY